MAISRHSAEWKRTIATAALLGVTFSRSAPITSRHGYHRFVWYAKNLRAVPGGIEGTSQIEVARKALRILGATISNLPDAAKTAAPASGADELRSSP